MKQIFEHGISLDNGDLPVRGRRRKDMVEDLVPAGIFRACAPLGLLGLLGVVVGILGELMLQKFFLLRPISKILTTEYEIRNRKKMAKNGKYVARIFPSTTKCGKAICGRAM
ncbi:MAG: hypothetical protein WDN09_01835 [bacterium]